MSEYTKAPWKVEEGVDGFPDIVSEDCGEIIGCEGFYSELDRDWANARHIVHCVNNYDRLVEGYRALRDQCDMNLMGVRSSIDQELRAADALLAQLDTKGEE